MIYAGGMHVKIPTKKMTKKLSLKLTPKLRVPTIPVVRLRLLAQFIMIFCQEQMSTRIAYGRRQHIDVLNGVKTLR